MNTESYEKTPRLGIAATVRNESPYILEWIAFHRAIGFTRFILSDDRSDDGTAELLECLQELHIVELLPPVISEGPRQLAVYREAMDRFGQELDWMAFIDADEFVMPSAGTVPEALISLLNRKDVGAIALNWACYGSNGHEEPSSELVLNRFTRRAVSSFGVNHHFKSLVRCSAYRSIGTNPHYVNLKSGWHYVHTDESRVIERKLRGLSKRVVWDRVRLNHYVVKSRGEFVDRKMLRGDAMTGNVPKTMAYFDLHDRNDTESPLDQSLLSKVHDELASLHREVERQNISYYARKNAGLRLLGNGTEIIPYNDTPVVFAHVFYPEIWEEMAEYLDKAQLVHRLVVTVSPGTPRPIIPKSAIAWEMMEVENRGRDVRPFLQALRNTTFDYELGLKIHTKRSVHREDGGAWRRALIDLILGEPERTREILRRLRKHTKIGLVAPLGHKVSLKEFEDDPQMVQSLIGDSVRQDKRTFIAGTMFWFRRECLADLKLADLDVFEMEAGQLRGTYAHAYERALSILAEERGFTTYAVDELLAGREPRSLGADQRAVSMFLRSFPITPNEFETRAGIAPALARNKYVRAAFRLLPDAIKKPLRRKLLQ